MQKRIQKHIPLSPYEKTCPTCQGTGYLDEKGRPWEGDVQVVPSFSHPYSTCWACQDGTLLTEQGESLLSFLGKYAEVLAKISGSSNENGK